MTAEIAILNKEAIALATDSAVTSVGGAGQKIFTSANKLFSLSKYHPVGLMIYGNAVFMGIPWETIIKQYRKKLSRKKFNTLEEYTIDFMAFLDNGNELFPESIQDEHARNSIYTYFFYIKELLEKKINFILCENGAVSDEKTISIFSEIIIEEEVNWKKIDIIPSITTKHNAEILNKYGTLMDVVAKDVFENMPLSKKYLNILKNCAVCLFSKFPAHINNSAVSGIVIAGFGEKELFPSLKSFNVECVANNKLKYASADSAKIDHSLGPCGAIMPFAQKEMVSVFMEGIDPQYGLVQEEYLSKLFEEYTKILVNALEKYNVEEKQVLTNKLKKINSDIFTDYLKKMIDHKRKTYIEPVINVVAMLPKDELAAMAESLVNLTSFKRKVTMEQETVGGPIDVAVISKGDGFIWIKRKHYFKAELNPQFFKNYYLEGQYAKKY